jgi:uncharacterized protein with von Willebrand factor type A (vWA) domain
MSNFMDTVRQKMGALSDNIDISRGKEPRRFRQQRPRIQLTRQIIKTTRFDEIDWNSARKDKTIDDGITEMYVGDVHDQDESPGYLNAPELVQDVFMAFLKPVPIMRKKREIFKDARLNGKFLEQLMGMPEYERLHDQTATDAMMSTMATGIVIDALKEMIKQHREQVKEMNERRKNGEKAPEGSNPADDGWDEETGGLPGEGGGSGGGRGKKASDPGGKTKGKGQSQFQKDPTDDGSDDKDESEQPEPEEPEEEQEQEAKPEGDDDAEDKADDPWGDEDDDADGQLDDRDREWDSELADGAGFDEDEAELESMLDSADFARGLHKALDDAANNIEDMNNAAAGVGLSPAEWRQMDPKRRLQIAEKLNTPRMKAIADMVGRMKRFAMSQQQTKVNESPHEIYDVEMGNDLRRVLRSEYALLGHEDTKVEFYRRYIDGGLLQFRERGHEDVGKGPIVCCIDNSGSMGGEPENWAKGVAEALRRICADQDRDFYVMYFETNYHRERFDFPKDEPVDFEKVLKFLSVSAGGGTEFDGVLTEALGRAKAKFTEKNEVKADIVFITDGQAYLDDKWIETFNKERNEIGVRVFSVYISAYDSSRGPAVKLLEKFSDIVLPVKALAVNDESTATIFSTI